MCRRIREFKEVERTKQGGRFRRKSSNPVRVNKKAKVSQLRLSQILIDVYEYFRLVIYKYVL